MVQDLRVALRLLRQRPTFALIAVLTLAFGIGANTVVLTLIDGMLLRALPFHDPDWLVAVETSKPSAPEIEPWTARLDLEYIRSQARSFAQVAGVSPVWNMVRTDAGAAERLETLYVSHEFFPMLGVRATAGRVLDAADDRGTAKSNHIVVTHALAQRLYGGPEQALQRIMNLDGSACTIIGVLPRGFRYPGPPVAGSVANIEVFLPLSDNQLAGSARSVRFLKVIARLKAGATLEQARQEVRLLGSRLAESYPDSNRGYELAARPLAEPVTGRWRSSLLLLAGAVGLILLLACANVANLLIGRNLQRGKEIAVRLALGSPVSRLVRLFLSEGVVLAGAGAAAGFGFAWFALAAIERLAPAAFAAQMPHSINLRALLATLAVAALTALLAGLPPALRVLRGAASAAPRLQRALVAVQVALALVLSTGAALLVRSFDRLTDVEPGFNPAGLVTVATQIPPAAARTATGRRTVWLAMQERLLSQPGVTQVGAVSRLPMGGANLGSWLTIEGSSEAEAAKPEVEYRVATPGYFAAMGIALLKGRLFDARDDADPASVVLINDSVARRYFPGQDPVGRRIKLGANVEQRPWITIIGVVGSVRHRGLDAEPSAEVYRPFEYSPLMAPILVVRAERPSASAVTEAIREVDPAIATYNALPMEALVERTTASRRFLMLLLSLFAVTALLFAALGTYGVAMQGVARRTREIGVRIALGATPGRIARLIVRQEMLIVTAGAVAGLLASLVLARFARSLLFGIAPYDAMSFGAAAAGLGLVAVLACLAPAWRASRIAPQQAMKVE